MTTAVDFIFVLSNIPARLDDQIILRVNLFTGNNVMIHYLSLLGKSIMLLFRMR